MKYDENFEKIMKYIFDSEGGFVDDADDEGGRTNYGVTQDTYNAWCKKNGRPLKDVKNINKEEAKQLYYEEFWKPTGAATKKDLREGYILFDMAINSGPYNTKHVFRKSNENIYQYLKDRKTYYEDLIKAKPKREKYREGWMNRLNDIKNNLDDIVNKGYYRPPYYNELTPYDEGFGNINLKTSSQIKINGKAPTSQEMQSIKNKYQYYKHKNNSVTGFAASTEQITPQQVSYTPEQIGKMSREEFDKNESAIMHQLQTGGFNQEPSRDFGGYRNSHTGDNRIYTAEDIGNFSSSEFSHHEPAINAQMNSIGIPTNNDMQNSGGTVYVVPHTRSDGVEVRGHYRSK